MNRDHAEVFIESNFESVQHARQARDRRLAELEAEGYTCRTENLRAIDTGYWVFVIYAEVVKVEPIKVIVEQPFSRSKPKPKKYQVEGL